MTTPLKSFIADIRARNKAATLGPWHAERLIKGEAKVFYPAGLVATTTMEADAESIARARNDLPRALAIVEVLANALEEQRDFGSPGLAEKADRALAAADKIANP